MEEETRLARDIFIRHLGSAARMHREGALKQYKQYGITREMELQWFQEMIAEGCGSLSIRDWEAVAGLEALSKNYQDAVIVDKTASFASRNLMSADSIVRLMYAEALVDIIRAHKMVITRELLFSACRVTVQLLESVVSQPLVTDPGHELQQLGLKDKRALNSRAKKSIEQVEQLIN
ncbi:hypothetical protein [Paenibacillus borealis]|uniref:Uncharacterized protein n=1 Tax=Paenibacillus borealis TaxID=160799 RepID=A0A089MTU5_PAEBO|nr:hypothetical protein [Paenibacillus borealis]AIQ59859.1 hypothetical protein PBOR_25070 [Paenibacillus borealis]